MIRVGLCAGLLAGVFGALVVAGPAYAVPALQVGAPTSGNTCADFPYEPYQGSLSDPTEEDTAVTSGTTLCVGGVYKGAAVVNLGSQYTGPEGTGLDWSDFTYGSGQNQVPYPSAFDTFGAILVVSVPEGDLAVALANLTINSNSAIHSDAVNSFLPNPPSNHDPAKGNIADFLFFDIGDFGKVENIPNFDPLDPDQTNAMGEILELLIGGLFDIAGDAILDWIHFDAMALETRCVLTTGPNKVCRTDITSTLDTDIQGNPGSHDVTWKPGDGPPPPPQVPEPGTLLLFGTALFLLGLGFRRGLFARQR